MKFRWPKLFRRRSSAARRGQALSLPPALSEEIAAQFFQLVASPRPVGVVEQLPGYDREPPNLDTAPLRRLYQRVSYINQFRVEIWPNEGKHRGRPHVAVTLPRGQISISLDDPPEILTPKRLPHEREALAIITQYRERLIDFWDESRPDTQRLQRPRSASH